MRNWLLAFSLSFVFGCVSGQDAARFITGKHYNIGIGYSDYITYPFNNSPRLTTTFGFEWEAKRSDVYQFEFGCRRDNFKYISYWKSPEQALGWEHAPYRDRAKETAIDFHATNWFKPFSRLPVSAGIGGSADFIFTLATYHLHQGYSQAELLIPFNMARGYGLMVQPSLTGGFRFVPEKVQRYSFELSAHYGLFTTRNLFSGMSFYNHNIYTDHRLLVTLSVNYSLDMKKNRELKYDRAIKRKLKRDGDTNYVSYNNSIYVEALGSGGLATINYERKLVSNKSWCELRLRGGLGLYEGPSFVLMPLYSFGYKRVRGEISAGGLIDGAGIRIPLVAGIRYEAKDGLFARLSYTPIFNPKEDRRYHNIPFPILFGASVGFQF